MSEFAKVFTNISPGESVLSSFEKRSCLLCNVKLCETFNTDTDLEQKRLFCKIFKVLPQSLSLEKDFDDNAFGKFCQLCSSNVTELCNLEKQMCQLKLRIEEMQMKIANCVVNSFATTSCTENGYFVKRQIYERWFERCHQVPANIWESTPMPLPTQISPVVAVVQDDEIPTKFNIRLAPVDKLIDNEEDNDSTCGFPASPPEDENSNDSVEVLYTPAKPVLPMPCVIKKVKKPKSSSKLKKKRPKKKKKRKIKKLAKVTLKDVTKTPDRNSPNHLDDEEPYSPVPPELSPIMNNCEESSPKELTAEIQTNSNNNNSHLSFDSLKPNPNSNSISLKSIATKKRGPKPKHLNTDRFICPFCQKKFTQKCNFDCHVRLHTGEKPFKCKICDRAFTSQGNKISHEATHDKSRYEGEPQFPCSICHKKYRFKKALVVHKLRRHHPNSKKCELCGSTVNDMQVHMEKLHTISEKRPCKCPTCHLTFEDDLYLQMHESVHSSVILFYRCKICRRGWKERSKLNQHLKAVHKVSDLPSSISVVPASECLLKMENTRRKVSSNRENIPKKTRKPPKVHMCDTCGKILKNRQSYLVHSRSHTGEKPYQCRHCDRTFNDRGNRMKHEVTHSKTRFDGEPQFECKDCQRKFHLKSSLYVHTRKHHLKTKYYDKIKCDICGAILSHRMSLTQHKKRWHSKTGKSARSLQCLTCLRVCTSETSLRIHTLQHVKSEDFKCAHCPTSSSDLFSKQNLYEHYRDSHPEIQEENVVLRRTYKCPWCPQNYFLFRSVLRHTAREHKRHINVNGTENKKRRRRKSQNIEFESTSASESDIDEEKTFTTKLKNNPVRKSSRVIEKTANKTERITIANQSDLLAQCKEMRVILYRIDEETMNDWIEIKEEIEYF